MKKKLWLEKEEARQKKIDEALKKKQEEKAAALAKSDATLLKDVKEEVKQISAALDSGKPVIEEPQKKAEA